MVLSKKRRILYRLSGICDCGRALSPNDIARLWTYPTGEHEGDKAHYEAHAIVLCPYCHASTINHDWYYDEPFTDFETG